MSWESSVFGLITVPFAWDGAADMNAAALDSLPDADAYPFLPRSMFGTTTQSQCYRDQAIHFGTTMKALPECWDEWVATDFKPGQPVEKWDRGDGPWTYAEFERLRDEAEREAAANTSRA